MLKDFLWVSGTMIRCRMPADTMLPSKLVRREKHKQWERALGPLGAMRHTDAPPDTIRYSSAISVCEKSGQLQSALGLLEGLPYHSLSSAWWRVDLFYPACCALPVSLPPSPSSPFLAFSSLLIPASISIEGGWRNYVLTPFASQPLAKTPGYWVGRWREPSLLF